MVNTVRRIAPLAGLFAGIIGSWLVFILGWIALTHLVDTVAAALR